MRTVWRGVFSNYFQSMKINYHAVKIIFYALKIIIHGVIII